MSQSSEFGQNYATVELRKSSLRFADITAELSGPIASCRHTCAAAFRQTDRGTDAVNSPMCQKPFTSATALIDCSDAPAQQVADARSTAAAARVTDACSCRERQPRRYAASGPRPQAVVPRRRCTASCRRCQQRTRRTFGPASDSGLRLRRLPSDAGDAAAIARSTRLQDRSLRYSRSRSGCGEDVGRMRCEHQYVA